GEQEHKSPMIPKPRFDEINSELREVKARLEAFEEQQRQAAMTPARDFAAERLALKASFDADDMELSDYLDARDKLMREETTLIADHRQALAAANQAKALAEQQWTAKVST